MIKRPHRRLSSRFVGIPSGVAAIVLVASCSNSAATVGPGSNPTPTPSASPAVVGGGEPQGSAQGQGGTEVLDLDVTGSIAGQQVAGKLTHTSFTVACVGAGPDQILAVHWIGTSPSGPGLNGTIDFKPGTWTLGDTRAQGSATIGAIGSKPGDSLVGTSGTVTTQTSGGSIDGTFDQGSGQVTVKGSWTCPGS